ncbi:MAG: flagellar basal body P-ring formation protein FlgA [Henriciella sp.]|nr:flagellar basal body P-ring formation protein FlgA [Henriciella sp.]
MISLICLALGLSVDASLTANEVLRAGSVITQENSSPADDVWQDQHAELLGREVSRTIYAGQPIAAKDTRAPRLVKRNQLVTLKYVKGPLEITLTGRALGEAGVNESVPVLNLESRQTVEGIVQAGGWIWVN